MNRLLLSLLAILAACSCQIKGLYETVPVVFTAVIEDGFSGGETRTSLDADGNVLWKRGDQVSIFAGSTVNEQYQVSDASDGKTSASLEKVSGTGFVAGVEIENNVAFYPYAAQASLARSGDAYVIRDVSLPATQHYAKASFGNGAFPMVAVTSSETDRSLKFKNVLGGVKLQLKGTATITAVSITGNQDETLCGAAEVTASQGSMPSVSLTETSAKTVTLDCGDDVRLDPETPTSFIIALPPQTFPGGFTVVVKDSGNRQMEIKTTKSQTIRRSGLLKMPAVTYEGIFVPSVPVPEIVDLGLRVKWASFNVGASKPEEAGDYFAWGETKSKNEYTWQTYRWCDGSASTLTKYCFTPSRGLNGFTDGKKALEPEDDAARVLLGEPWRLPTDEEILELVDTTKCRWQWTSLQGVPGYRVTSLVNGNSIFLPASGRYYRTYGLQKTDTDGYYWSSDLNGTNTTQGYCLHFAEDAASIAHYGGERSSGHVLRAVTE